MPAWRSQAHSTVKPDESRQVVLATHPRRVPDTNPGLIVLEVPGALSRSGVAGMMELKDDDAWLLDPNLLAETRGKLRLVV